jgi:G3E family GTPase
VIACSPHHAFCARSGGTCSSRSRSSSRAVIINEFAEIGIDHQLVVTTQDEIVQMNNGCICGTVRGDLLQAIERILQRAERVDHLVIETTGLADPAPIIQSFSCTIRSAAR